MSRNSIGSSLNRKTRAQRMRLHAAFCEVSRRSMHGGRDVTTYTLACLKWGKHRLQRGGVLVRDAPDMKDVRRGRAAAQNIVPSTTGAAEAVIQAIPELRGKFQAESIRVPTITGSISITSALLEKKTDAKKVNEIFKKAAKDARWAKVLRVTKDQIVSSDIVGEPYGAIIDLSLTQVLENDFVKIFSWYDNESGYTATLAEHVRRVAESL